MAWFAAAIWGFLFNVIGTLAGKVLIGLGISVVTYTGLSASIDFLKSGAISSFSGLPVEVIGILSLMKVGSCISMVFSAITVRMTIQGMTGDTMKSWVKK